MIKLLVISVITLLGSVSAVDYCTATPCKTNHVACNNSGDFGPNCPADDRSVIEMTPQLITVILNKHNTIRMDVANGKVSGKNFTYESASRMIELAWDSELSSLAVLTAKTCVMVHDKCRQTVAFPSTGQCLASGSKRYTTNTTASYINAINSFIDLWYYERVNGNVSQINYLTGLSNSDGTVYGHFFQLIVAKVTRIGCGMSRYSQGAALLVCNYSKGFSYYVPVYVPGPPCSGCTSGCSVTYPGLCSTNEIA